MTNSKRYSPEVRERAVRMVFEHADEHASQWEAICSIADKKTVCACTANQESDGRTCSYSSKISVDAIPVDGRSISFLTTW